MMKRQSRRATLLTLLAAFYLPLTLTTGIFGMNIKEFGEGHEPSMYLCFEALFAVLAVTMVFYGLYRYLPLAFHALKGPSWGLFERWSFVRKICYIISTLERHRRYQRADEIELEEIKSREKIVYKLA
jgi:hypothetical protein